MSYAPGPMRHARRVAASEFGGPWPLLAAVVALPAVVYYLWISLEYYAGALPLPASAAPADFVTFVRRMIGHVVSGAGPTRTAIVIYAVWVGWQVLLAPIGPGPKGPGPVLPDGTRRRWRRPRSRSGATSPPGDRTATRARPAASSTTSSWARC